ncbi:hypothetical protein M8J76_015236 [Diaphorina citri]|nr:hypothetical protein M8J76_015236 [Diaphorina citri]
MIGVSTKSRSEQLRDAARQYAKNNPEVNQRAVAKYTQNNPKVNQRAVAKYTQNNPEVNQRAVAKYTQNNPEVNQRAVAKYTQNNPEVNQRAVAKYTQKNPESHQRAVASYTEKNPEVHRKAVAVYSSSHPEAEKNKQDRYYFNKKFPASGKIFAVDKLGELLHDRLEAEKIVKWVIQNRNSVMKTYLKQHESLRTRLTASITKLQSLTTTDCTVNDKVHALLGKLQHCRTQEPYPHPHNQQCDTNVIDSSEKFWPCEPPACNLTHATVDQVLKAFRYLSDLSHAKFYSSVLNTDKTFHKHFGSLTCNKHHSPSLRTITRQVYALISVSKQLHNIDTALKQSDVGKLKELGNTHNSKLVSIDMDFSDGENDVVTEDDIIEKYHTAFSVLSKRSLDTPKNECMSCRRLLCLRDVTNVKRIRKPIVTEVWTKLQAFYDSNDITPSPYVCHTCIGKLRSNTMPSTCVLNDLHYAPVPDEIKNLNNFEKMLIQRAKAFQVVSCMIPVGKKHIPNRHAIKKVKGRAFHLPLPLDSTLKKLPKVEDPLNKDQELFVLMRSSPSKNKVIWQDLVDVNKVYSALAYLKDHNLHYAKIVLPVEPVNLLDGLDPNIQYDVQAAEPEEEDQFDIQGVDEQEGAMITQIFDEQEESNGYEQYTIYPLNEKKKNAPVTALYQMLKVNAAPIDSRERQIDVLCFPDLFVEGRFGQFHNRFVKLTSAEFIKTVLTSADARFRLNQQYLFYLLHDANMRQLSAGIFYKLNVTNQHEKLTAASYLDKISNDELEGDLQAIFGRLRNTEQFWKKPRSDVICMTKNYGPATWFLTISPSEWDWDDLGKYIREVNGADMAHMTTSQLVALDPVSASRFIDVKFKAMLEFLTSADAPLGEIIHYFWRREYQSRGLQHFHLMLWVKDAPLLEETTVEDVAKFISQYVTCEIPDKAVSPTLYERVMRYQIHRHNSYCLRKKKTNHSFVCVCRFGFPRPVADSIEIRSVAESIAARKTLTSNKRLYNIELENTHLYDFARLYDIVSTRPASPNSIYLELSDNKFLKKRDRPYLINHYMYDVNKAPENFFFAILLLFKPWRDLSSLKVGQNSYTEAFNSVKLELKDGLNYSDLQIDFVTTIDKAFDLIEKKISELEDKYNEPLDNIDNDDDRVENPLQFEPLEAQNAMGDFRQANETVTEEDLELMIANLNADQLRIFNNITRILSEGSSVLRQFVSGTGGTGKSYVIKTIEHWVRLKLNKSVAVCAPTGIAAFNVNGLTIHRLLQLPVEHGQTPKYKPLSDQVLQVLRADLSDVKLLIIDEVSMISNVTLLFIHLRLTEIFDTNEEDDGWFGSRNIIFFGDLLQLPPVREKPSYETISSTDARKIVGSLGVPNLWKDLFSYDELTINMRQKDDSIFADMLTRIRLGVLSQKDESTLTDRLVSLEQPSLAGSHEVSNGHSFGDSPTIGHYAQ